MMSITTKQQQHYRSKTRVVVSVNDVNNTHHETEMMKLSFKHQQKYHHQLQWYRYDPYTAGVPKVFREADGTWKQKRSDDAAAAVTAAATNCDSGAYSESNFSCSSSSGVSCSGGDSFLTSIDITVTDCCSETASLSSFSTPSTPSISRSTSQKDAPRRLPQQQFSGVVADGPHTPMMMSPVVPPCPMQQQQQHPMQQLVLPTFSPLMPPLPPLSLRHHHQGTITTPGITSSPCAPPMAPQSISHSQSQPSTPTAISGSHGLTLPIVHEATLGSAGLRFHSFEEAESFSAATGPEIAAPPAHDLLTRLFLGQLTTSITTQQLAWICATFANGTPIYHCDRITRAQKGSHGKAPTGCFHLSVPTEKVEMMREFLNDSLLIEDGGVWIATNATQRDHLVQYCAAMKENKNIRPTGRPYGTMVVQLSTSAYTPPTPAPLL